MATFRELQNKNSYKSVFNEIYKKHLKGYPDHKVMDADLSFLHAWTNLSSLSSNPTEEWKIHFVDRGGKEESVFDICWYSVKDDELYAMDFIPWEELIDAEAYVALDMPEKEILAHILWEITFWGFSSDQVISEGKNLK